MALLQHLSSQYLNLHPHRFSHRRCALSLNSHTKEVTAIKWGGDGLLYSASRDTSVLVWETTECVAEQRS